MSSRPLKTTQKNPALGKKKREWAMSRGRDKSPWVTKQEHLAEWKVVMDGFLDKVKI